MRTPARHRRWFRGGGPPSSPAAKPPRCAARGLTAGRHREGGTDAETMTRFGDDDDMAINDVS